MKRILLALLSLLAVCWLQAQEPVPIAQVESDKYLEVIGDYEHIAQFSVIYAKQGDRNISQQVLDAGVYTLFYKLKGTSQYGMANVSASQQTLTYGRIFEVQHDTEYQDPIPTQIYTFEWDYHNSFDGGKGTYMVRFEMNNTGQGGTIAELRMGDIDADEVTVYKEASSRNYSALGIE